MFLNVFLLKEKQRNYKEAKRTTLVLNFFLQQWNMIKVEVHHELAKERIKGEREWESEKGGVVWMELHLHVKAVLFVCIFVNFRKTCFLRHVFQNWLVVKYVFRYFCGFPRWILEKWDLFISPNGFYSFFKLSHLSDFISQFAVKRKYFWKYSAHLQIYIFVNGNV